jgi:predicted oxidoreductase
MCPIFVSHLRIPQRKMRSDWMASSAAEHSMATPSSACLMNRKLTNDQRKALGMLAASLRGRMESVMQAHGVAIGTLRGLVRAGLATADRGPTYFSPGAIVTMLQITEVGRRAIDT